MQHFDNAPAFAGTEAQANDLGPLAWVLDELRKSLDGATKALRRFVRDADLARGSDLSAVDAGQLRISRQQLHQAVGALEMVGFAEPATILRGMENAVQRFVAKPELCTEAAVQKIERASFALTGYLEAVLAGKSQSPIALFEQYAHVQEIAGATRVHPADLWPFAWRWNDVADTGVAPMAIADARSEFDKSALMVIKAFDLPSAANLAKVCAAVAMPAGVAVDKPFTIFWRIAAGFFEALATGCLANDVYVKRTVSRLLMQLAGHAKGDMAVSDRLAQDMLFFCAQSQPASLAPLLGEVRLAYGLAAHVPVNYAKSPFGQFDPALLAQARKRISAAKESWSGLAAGETAKSKAVLDQFGLIADSIGKLLPQGQALSKALTSVADTAAKTGQAPEPALGMEVATAILYLEVGFDDFDPNDPALAERVNHLAKRVENARLGATDQALEPWMEELYRRVSDRQTMGSVVGELKTSLAELEKSMDQFFRDPQDKTALANVPARLAQMRGVLSVLGLDQASTTVLRMRETIEQMMAAELDDVRERAAGTFDKLGNNLGALGFLIDMLSYQPVLAKKLFVFDDARGELRPLMGRVNTPVPQAHKAADVAVAQSPPQVALASTLTVPATAASAAVAAVTVGAASAAAVTAATAATATASTAAATTTVMTSTVPVQAAPPAATLTVGTTEAEAPLSADDAELRDIFLEEAREVIGNGQQALAILAHEPSNLSEMTVLRRAFHTLKGSSRMVGLNAFGDAGWSYEQLLNSWLADQKAADDALRTTASQGLDGMARWADDIAAGKSKRWAAAPFVASADALRLKGQFLPLSIEGLTVSVPAEQPAEQPSELPAPVVETPVADAPAVVASLEPDFEFDLDLPQLDAPVQELPELPLAEMDQSFDALPTMVQGLEAVASDDADFALDLGEASSLTDHDQHPSMLDLSVPAAAAAAAGLGYSMTMAAPLRMDLPEVPRKAVDVFNLDGVVTHSAGQADAHDDELVSAEELAAFERAMLEMDVAPPAAQDLPTRISAYADFDAQATQPMAYIPFAPTAPAPVDLGLRFDDLGAAKVAGIGLVGAGLLAASAAAPAPTVAAATAPAAVAPPQESSASAPAVTLAAATLAASTATATVDMGASPDIAPTVRVSSAHEAAPVAAPSTLSTSTPELAALLRSGNSGPMGLGPDDQYKAVGPLRISLPLYNVYLNEADEWSRRLVTCLTEWSLEADQPLPNDAVVFAHSLAGSSATVGFTALSGLARTMEHALQHVQGISEDAAYSAHLHAADFVGAAEEVRRLLHQFAAGQLREPLASVEAALNRCMLAPEPSVQELSLTASAPESGFIDIGGDEPVQSGFDELADNSNVTVIAAAAAVTAVAADVSSVTAEPGSANVVSLVAPVPHFAPVGLVAPVVLSVVPRSMSEQEAEDEIDVQDALDPDLFQIFEEEAQELLPQLGGALRQWTARPDNTGARAEVLRGLHTLKGSARIAGALRLGELAHRMETAIEQTPEHEAHTAQLEPLTGLLDGLQANFDRLRHPQETEQPVVHPAAADGGVDSPATALPSSTSTALNPMAPLRTASTLTGSKLAAPVLRSSSSNQTVRVRSQLLDRLVNQAGEVMITRSRLEAELSQLRGSLGDLTANLDKLRVQLRDIEVQSESQMQSRMALVKEANASFDPLEFDRFTRVQELTRMMAESVNDVATVQRSIQRTVEATEDDLVAQARQTRELQRDLLRTRMVEFEGISERLYRVVRQAGKDAGKQVKLDIIGGSIEMDRGVLDRMTPAFEHLLRNCVAHGIEDAQTRVAAGKDASGQIIISLHHEGNDVSVEFRDDGAGLNLARIRERAVAQGLLTQGQPLAEGDAANLIFTPGFTTATQITELSGRGIGMDVVRSEVVALGGRIETSTSAGQGTNFKLVLPLTTAVTQVVMLRIGNLSVGVPAILVETVRRATPKEVQAAYNSGSFEYAGESLPFFWSGALLQHSRASDAPPSKTMPILVFRSAAQRIVVHVDEVLGNQEVVVKNLGPQLSRLPGLAGMSLLASGAVALIYNPVVLAKVYGEQARALSADKAEPHVLARAVTDVVARDLTGDASPVVPLVPANPRSISAPQVPLILVVDDSITVRRVTQRLLMREGYRVALAADGLLALERLAEELPSVVLTDIEMPRMDGFDLVRNIKADPRLAGLPIITITSRIAEKHREHALALGVNHYLGKPFSEEELLSLIRHYTAADVPA